MLLFAAMMMMMSRPSSLVWFLNVPKVKGGGRYDTSELSARRRFPGTPAAPTRSPPTRSPPARSSVPRRVTPASPAMATCRPQD
ncbi:hypothetical protein EYF80_061134 [Liparis tanakae]|uniref:Secreted protein n=1 Tax=Liparis tanakae TaxID=230148 RepID=A0A4Z2EJG7_9TELE|nr:hypothetical protein EYF80_061134 [Liparis tanakae]